MGDAITRDVARDLILADILGLQRMISHIAIMTALAIKIFFIVSRKEIVG